MIDAPLIAVADATAPGRAEPGGPLQITESGVFGAVTERLQIAVPRAPSTGPPRVLWPRTNDLGALDLSARSGADRVCDAGAD